MSRHRDDLITEGLQDDEILVAFFNSMVRNEAPKEAWDSLASWLYDAGRTDEWIEEEEDSREYCQQVVMPLLSV